MIRKKMNIPKKNDESVVERVSAADKPSLEGIWHASRRPDWVLKFCVIGGPIYIAVTTLAHYWQDYARWSDNRLYYPAPDLAMDFLAQALGAVIVFVFAYFLFQSHNMIKLKFDDGGLAFQMKSGIVINVSWHIVKRIRFVPIGKGTAVSIIGQMMVYEGYFSKEVNEALVRKFRQMREKPSSPPTLEELVDSRLQAHG